MSLRSALFASTLSLAAISCGPPPGVPGGPLERPGPFLPDTRTPQRMIVLTNHRPPATLGEPGSCNATAFFFDPHPTNQRSRNQLAREAECTLYPPPVDLLIPNQNWLCLGGLSVTAGANTETLSFCPAQMIGAVGAAGLVAPVPGCAVLAMGSMVSASSMMEFPEDQVPDLNLSVAMPAPVAITSPISTPLGAWPTMGDVNVRWTSAGSTSAVVVLEARDTAGGAAASIVCLPGTNGQVFIPSALLAQSNLRTREARLTVATYTDRVGTATGSEPAPRLSAGFSTSVILQPNR
jgi:hypothetical protein